MCGIVGSVNVRLSRDDLEKVLRGFDRDLYHAGRMTVEASSVATVRSVW
jgi:hypothetical protein